MPHIHLDHADAEKFQEEQWASQAGIHGKPLTLPPQKDKHKARQTDKDDPRSLRNRERRFGDKDSVEGQIPGVGSSPTAELETEEMESAEQREGTGNVKVKTDEEKEVSMSVVKNKMFLNPSLAMVKTCCQSKTSSKSCMKCC